MTNIIITLSTRCRRSGEKIRVTFAIREWKELRLMQDYCRNS